MRFAVKALLSILGILALTTSALALVIHVPGEYATIQEGIDASITGDTVLVADGTYSGSGNADLNFGGRDIVLMSENGPHFTIIDCQTASRGMTFISGETRAAQVIGITVTNGVYFEGGGIHITNASPTFTNCIIHACQSYTQGGGVYVFQGNPTFTHCVLHSNYASEGGGLSAEASNVTVNSCIVAANSSSG